MAIPDADPRAQELDAAFAAAMDGPARPVAAAKTPGEVDHDAPHGRDDDGKALAPYGLTKDGKPKKTAGGRPPKDDPNRPRTATVTGIIKPGDKPGHEKKPAKPEPHDYSGALENAATAAWFGLSAIGKISGSIPIIGGLLPGDKLAAQAFILHETKGNLIGAVNLAAQHNVKAAEFAAKFDSEGSGLWALTAMFMVMPVVSMSVSVWKGDEALAKEEMPSLADMGSKNESLMEEMLDSIKATIVAQMEQAQPQAQAPAEQQPAA